MSSNAAKKVLKGDVRALKHVCGKNTSGKGVKFYSKTLSTVLRTRNHGLKLQQERVRSGFWCGVFFCKRSTEIDFWERISSTGGFKGGQGNHL